jgi:hypothetical protein
MVPNTEGGISKEQSALSPLDAEDHAELAIRMRKANLYAIRKCRPFRPLLLTGKKMLGRDSILLIVFPSRQGDHTPGIARAVQVLSESCIVKQRGCATHPLVVH